MTTPYEVITRVDEDLTTADEVIKRANEDLATTKEDMNSLAVNIKTGAEKQEVLTFLYTFLLILSSLFKL